MTIEKVVNLPTYYKTQTTFKKLRLCYHTNQGPEEGSAISLAEWQQRPAEQRKPPNKGGYHEIVDKDTVAVTAAITENVNGAKGDNTYAYHICMLGYAEQSREQWLDPTSREIIRNAAERGAAFLKSQNLPGVKLTPSDIQQQKRGVEGHGDVSAAFVPGGHTDPGADFPWDVMMADINFFLHVVPPEEELTEQEWSRMESLIQKTVHSVLKSDAVAGAIDPNYSGIDDAVVAKLQPSLDAILAEVKKP